MADESVPKSSMSGRGQSAAVPALTKLLRLSAAVTATGYAAERLRSLHVSGIFLALSGIGSVLVVSHLGAPETGDIVALRVLAYSCWLYGGLGLFALLSPKSLLQQPSALAELRGQMMDTPLIRGAGYSLRLALGMLIASLPGLVTALILSPTMGTVTHRALLLLIASLYLISLGVLMGTIGAFCANYAPRAPRTCAVSVVVGPFVASLFAEEVPSIIGLYSWGLATMIEWGARA